MCCQNRPNLISNALKCVGGWGSAPDPAGGAYDTPPDPLVGRGFAPSALATTLSPSCDCLSPPWLKFWLTAWRDVLYGRTHSSRLIFISIAIARTRVYYKTHAKPV